MRVLHALTLTVAALLLGACGSHSASNGSTGIGPTDPTTGNGAGASPPPAQFHAMFNVEGGIFPYPTDIYFATGPKRDGTLNIPTDFAALSPLQAFVNQLDGFSTTADITLRFSAPINPATLPANVRVIQVVIDNATKATTGVLGILRPGVDVSIGVSTDTDAVGSVLLIHPLKPLVASTGATNNGYLVLVSDGVKAADGTPAIADTDYQVIRDNAIGDLLAGLKTPKCAALTNATFNGLCRLTFAHLAIGAQLPGGLAIAPNHVVASWSFSTESTRDTLGYVAATTGPRPYTVTATGLTTATLGLPVPGIADVYQGTLNIPYYLGIPSAADPTAPLTKTWMAAGPSPNPNIDQNSRYLTRFNPFPIAKTADLDIPLLILVPNAGSGHVKPPTGWPVVVFMPGLREDRSDALLLADTMAAAGFAVVSMDQPLHGITPSSAAFALPLAQTPIERTFNLDYQNNDVLGSFGHPDGKVDPTGANVVGNFGNPAVLRDLARQGSADMIALIRTIPTIDLDPATNPGPDFDPNQIHLLGYSLGSEQAGAVLGLLGPEIKASGLPSAVSVLSVIAQESGEYAPILNAGLKAEGVLPGTMLYSQFWRDWQSAFDAGDPINYVANAVGPASGNRSILLSQFVGGAGGFTTDQTVPVSATQRVIDQIGIITRVSAPGATNVAGTNGAYVQFSQGIHNSLLDGRPSLATTKEIQREYATFFATGGTLVVITDPTVIAP